jgi:hypothetical protein
MWLDYGVGLCQPDVFDKALAARRESLRNVKIRSCLTMKLRAVLEEDPRHIMDIAVGLEHKEPDRLPDRPRRTPVVLANFIYDRSATGLPDLPIQHTRPARS